MRVASLFSAVAIAAAAVSVAPDAMAQRNRGGGQSSIVVDYQRVGNDSVLGRDFQTKLGTLRQQFATEAQALVPEEQSLQQEGQRLAQATRTLTPQQIQASSTWAPQIQQYQQRRQQFESRAQQLRADLECSNLIAARDFENQIQPVIRQVMQSRGAGIVINASNAAMFAPEVDATTTVIQQLDQNQNTRTANVVRRAYTDCQSQQQAAAPVQQ